MTPPLSFTNISFSLLYIYEETIENRMPLPNKSFEKERINVFFQASGSEYEALNLYQIY